MPYPYSPFSETFDHNLVNNLPHNENSSIVCQEQYEATLKWLCTTPGISSYRVNSLKCVTSEIVELLNKHFCGYRTLDDPGDFEEQTIYLPRIQCHPILSDVIMFSIYSDREDNFQRFDKEIIVDVECASAVLRGAHIYASGILGMSAGTQIGNHVSIYADLSGKCKRGFQKLYNDIKMFIGNGIAQTQRYQLFGQDVKPSGLGVKVFQTISGCRTFDERIVPQGSVLLQNLPSILCVLALNPQPGETIIDLCASPGNKTTHIAELMENKGILIAIDKTPRKVAILREKCDIFGATNVQIFQANSTKILLHGDGNLRTRNLPNCPPFPEESFDRVLLDAPCSALGKRPQLANRMNANEIKSFVPLQRKLMETAVRLLKPGGTLVYSTCTITLAENEGIVSWALKLFENMSLITPIIRLGGPGWPGTSLTDNQLNSVQRFGPDSEVDSVGFFFCVFTKKRVPAGPA